VTDSPPYVRDRDARGDDGASGAKVVAEASSPPKVNYHVKLSEVELKPFPGGLFRQLPVDDPISNNTMWVAYLKLLPGGVRELHWHPSSAEWGYVSEGTCLITLMNNEGRYANELVREGQVWYFPQSWGHSIYGQDSGVGCTMVLFFDDAQPPTYNDLSISQMLSYFPRDVVSENLGVPVDVLETFPESILIVNSGPPPPQAVPVSKSPLPQSPVFTMTDGPCGDLGRGGYYFQVRQEQFAMSSTMSGAFMHLESGTLRDIHWHPNADEMQYVLRGSVTVGVYGTGGINTTYTLNAGDVGFVPRGFMHYIQTSRNDDDDDEEDGGPADLLLTFNHPSWTTQELSTWLSVAPPFVAARSLNTTVDVVEKYLPTSAQEFYGRRSSRCPVSEIVTSRGKASSTEHEARIDKRNVVEVEAP
jgi:oxalate decarboxylase